MNISFEELYMLLGAKDVEIYNLQKEIQKLVKQLKELADAKAREPLFEDGVD